MSKAYNRKWKKRRAKESADIKRARRMIRKGVYQRYMLFEVDPKMYDYTLCLGAKYSKSSKGEILQTHGTRYMQAREYIREYA